MSDNVKIAAISGIVSVAVAGISAAGVIYSQKTDLQAASQDVESATIVATQLRSEITSPNLPQGAVVAFRLADCPSNWERYDIAKGRVVVGVGTGSGLSARTLEQIGGEEKTALAIGHMPTHSHQHDDWHYHDGARVDKNAATKRGDDNGHLINKGGTTKPEGSGKPHNNIQPFVALLYCRKT